MLDDVRGFLREDAEQALLHSREIGRILLGRERDLWLVFDDRPFCATGLHAFQHMRSPDRALVRYACIGADRQVRLVAAHPGAGVLVVLRVIFLLPFRIRHTAHCLGGQIDAIGRAQAPLPQMVLLRLRIVGKEECLADLVEDDVAGIGDARLDRHCPVSRLLPAILPVGSTEAGPEPCAVVGRCDRRDAIAERREARERLDGRS